MVESFLATPIDSRWDYDSPDPSARDAPPSPIRRPPRGPVRVHHVAFDWDTSVRQITDRLIRPRAVTRNGGLPDIAKREIKQEIEARRRVRRCPEWFAEAAGPETLVLPSRKNEIPNVRKDPGILRPSRKRHRFL
jgi:hypothetical protein